MENKRDKEEKPEPSRRGAMHYELARRPMTEEELKKITDMNWEWYYNCYLHKDEPIPISCKVCGWINVFSPGEKKKRCAKCGIEYRRCEVEEEL